MAKNSLGDFMPECSRCGETLDKYFNCPKCSKKEKKKIKKPKVTKK